MSTTMTDVFTHPLIKSTLLLRRHTPLTHSSTFAADSKTIKECEVSSVGEGKKKEIKERRGGSFPFSSILTISPRRGCEEITII